MSNVWSSLLMCQKCSCTQLLRLAKFHSAVEGEEIATSRRFFFCSSALAAFPRDWKLEPLWKTDDLGGVNKQIGTIWRRGVTGEWFVGWTANRGSHEPPTTLRLCLAMRKTWTRFVSHVQHLSSITVILPKSMNTTSTSSHLLSSRRSTRQRMNDWV